MVLKAMIPNNVRKTLGAVWGKIWDPWWGFYYKHGSSVPPYKYYGYMGSDRDEELIQRLYLKDYDPVCFPLPFRVNCFGCMGCRHVKEPPLHPDKPKGSWKVYLHPVFLEQYTDLFGKQATFELVNNMRKRNNDI